MNYFHQKKRVNYNVKALSDEVNGGVTTRKDGGGIEIEREDEWGGGEKALQRRCICVSQKKNGGIRFSSKSYALTSVVPSLVEQL